MFRNIPACAGKTVVAVAIRLLLEEHPRVRGENGVVSMFDIRISGTSPRARGKRAGR